MKSAVIDIGSNSIKLLVAEGERARPLFEAISETRLSPNLKCVKEKIPNNAFSAGIAAVCDFQKKAQPFLPDHLVIVGTYLLRAAENASLFSKAVWEATGIPVQILSGIEEAELVAEGVATDPLVKAPCVIFDLGGGSLEIVKKTTSHSPVFAQSLPLGGVKMMRKFLSTPTKKIPIAEIESLRNFIREKLGSSLSQSTALETQAVFCGGSAEICARLLGGERTPSEKISTKLFDDLLSTICKKTQQERTLFGIPEKRADIFPAACATLAEICSIGGFSEFIYTRRNLRYGLCARLNKNEAL